MVKKIIIIAVVAALIVGAVLVVYKLLNPKNAEIISKGYYIEATFLVEAIRPEIAECIKIGDTLYDSQGKASMQVTEIRTEPTKAKYVYYDQNLLYVEDNSILKDVYITAKSVSKKYAWAYAYGKDLIMSGAHLAVYGENWKVWAIVLTVKEAQ